MSRLTPNQPPPYNNLRQERSADSSSRAPQAATPQSPESEALPQYEGVAHREPQRPSRESGHQLTPPTYKSEGVHGIYNMMAGVSMRFATATGMSSKEKNNELQLAAFDAGEKARSAAGHPTLADKKDEHAIKEDKKTPWGSKRFHYPGGEIIRIPFEPKAQMTRKEASTLNKLQAKWKKEFGDAPFPGNASVILRDEKSF